jgi:DNA replication protein DnaC
MMITTALTEARIDIACGQLRMPSLMKHNPELLRDALEQNADHLQFLASCLEHEVLKKQEQKQLHLLRQAKFPKPKTLQEFQFTHIPKLPKMKVEQLAQGIFIPRRENVICIGRPGTGKSHIATAIGMGAMLAGYRVRFVSVMQLIQELQLAETAYRLPRFLKSWSKYDLVILDELGYVPLGEGGKLLFQFISGRYEQGSLIITSNLEFSRWVDVFGDPALTTALLDRLTHHSHILLFDGVSYRFRQTLGGRGMEVPHEHSRNEV